MAVHDITGAAARLASISVDGYAAGRNRPGMCLRWSYFAVGIRPNLTPANIAMDAWTNAPAEHRHPIGPNTLVPKDVPIILGPSPTRTDSNKGAGDVYPAAQTGRGYATPGVMTDSPLRGAGYIGGGTIAQRAAQTGRPVLGYLTHWLGYDITTAGMASIVTPSLETVQEYEMTQMRLIKNNTRGDANYGSVDLICVETGFFWHVPNTAYQASIEKAYGIKTESLEANWWSFWRQLATGHRDALGDTAAKKAAAAVWGLKIDGFNGVHSAGDRLAGIDKKAGTATLEPGAIKLPTLTITGKAVAA